MKFSFQFSSVLRACTLAVALSSALWLTSCDDDPEPDKVLPELTVTNLADNATVWDVVSVSLEASDDRGIDKVELFVDGSLVKSFTEAPFTADWDTNTLTEGAHTVKVVATDKAGNVVEKMISVTVKNVLVSFKVPANHLWSEGTRTTRGFVFLSGADGKLIKSVEFQNGQDVEIKAPGFKGETFTLTQVMLSIYSDANGTRNYPYMWTFAQVERGKWTLLSEMPDDEASIGQAKLNFSNDAADVQYRFRSPEGYESYAEAGTTSANITLVKTPSTLYATRFSYAENGLPAPAYRLFNNIVVGNNAINLALVSTPLTKITATTPAGFDYVTIQLNGTLVANDFTNSFYLGSNYKSDPAITTLDYYKPGNAFASYFAEVYVEESGYYLGRGSRNADQLNFAEPQYTGTMTFSGGKITSTLAGSFDFVSTSYEDDSQDAQWSFIMPSGANVSLTVPEVPETLKSFNIPVVNGTPEHFWIYDFESITNYDGLKSFIRTSTYGVDELYAVGKEYAELSKRLTPTNGRKQKEAMKRDLPSSREAAREKN